MKHCLSLGLVVSQLWAHNPDAELPIWTQYLRLGIVQAVASEPGLATYGRFKRTTEYTFRDVRFFGHFFEEDQEVRFRQKTSRRFMTLDWLYSFNTLVYERNTLQNVDLRYHYNQGLGWLIRNSPDGNMTMETGVAFDNSDYLNTEQKTSYLRGAVSTDQRLGRFETKFELDYFHQMSQQANETDLSRWQIVLEGRVKLKNRTSLIFGLTQDNPKNESIQFDTMSLFVTLSLKQPLKWTL